MPKTVTPKVFFIGETKPNTEEMREWLDSLGVSQEFEIPGEDVIPESEVIPALGAKRCYMSYEVGLNPNVTQVRKDYAAYFTNILEVGHGSVLEHTVFNLAIENVSRVFTAEMNRHRAGWAISEGSMRFIRFDQCIPWVIPPSIRGADDFDHTVLVDDALDLEYNDDYFKRKFAELMVCEHQSPGSDDSQLAWRKQLTREIFNDVFSHVEQRYRQLLSIWDMDATDKNFAYKKAITSCLRRIVPLGVSTGGVWSGNIRALRHVLTMRCAPSAEEEICEVFSMVAKRMSEQHPHVFGDFHQNEHGYWVPKYVGV